MRAAGTGPTPRLLPLLTLSGAASAAEGRVPGEHGPPARLSCRGWRAVLPLLGTVSTPAQPQVTTRLAPGPVGGVCDRPPHEEVDLTSFPHPAGGQQGGLSNLVGQETGQELKLEEPDLAQPGVDRAEGAWPGQGRRAGQRACPGQRAWPGGGAWPGQSGRGRVRGGEAGPRRRCFHAEGFAVRSGRLSVHTLWRRSRRALWLVAGGENPADGKASLREFGCRCSTPGPSRQVHRAPLGDQGLLL